jgi:hypothetical protein
MLHNGMNNVIFFIHPENANHVNGFTDSDYRLPITDYRLPIILFKLQWAPVYLIPIST